MDVSSMKAIKLKHKNFLFCALLSSIVLSGCGDENDIYKHSFIDDCESAGSPISYCECVFDDLNTKYPDGKLEKIDKMMQGGYAPSHFINNMSNARQQCGSNLLSELQPEKNTAAIPVTETTSSTASIDTCVMAWTDAFHKENSVGDLAVPVTADQLSEWEDWCKQGKHPN